MTSTGWLMPAGCDQFCPLCPGSSTITLPASGRLGAVALADGAPAGEREEPPCGAGVTPRLAVAPSDADAAPADAVVAPPEAGASPPDADTAATQHPANGAASAAATAKAAAARV